MSEKFNIEKSIETPETEMETKKILVYSAIEKIKDKISNSKRNIKKTLILSSIPLMVLAGEANVRADELKNGKQAVQAEEMMEREKVETETEIKEVLKIGEEEKNLTDNLSLNSIEDKKEKEDLREKIGLEITALNLVGRELDKSLREKVKKNPLLVSEDIREKCDKNEPIFNFGKQMIDKIKGAEDSSQQNNRLKVFENGRINFKNIAKLFPAVLAGFQTSIILHEIGQKEQAFKEGADSVDMRIGFLSGKVRIKGLEEKSPRFRASGIRKPIEFGEFLTESLKQNNSNDQLKAIFALTSKSHGFLYGIRTKLGLEWAGMPPDDIRNYAKLVGVSEREISTGLMLDFLLNKNNWRLLRIALGEEGVKFPESTVRFFYEIGSELSVKGEPVAGIKFEKKF